MSAGSNGSPLVVSLSIPCRAEYVGVARLAILGVASRLEFSFDEVEDLRLAVGEACTGAIERAAASHDKASDIRIRCEIQPQELAVEVNYKCGAYPAAKPVSEGDPENIGALLMDILVDSVEIRNDPDTGTTIRLTKVLNTT